MPNSITPSKENTGITRIGLWNSDNDSSTIIVVGAGRGGTSACAAVGSKLGLFLGNSAQSPIYEDSYLAEAIETNNWSQAKEIAFQYTAKHGTWLYKRPSSIEHLQFIKENFHNPKFIFVLRDPQATSHRVTQLTPKSNHISNLRHVLEVYYKVLDFIERHNPTGLLVSYEKLISNPSTFISELTCLSNIPDLPPHQLTEIANTIKASPKEYTNTLNTSRFIGHIDLHNSRQISGWAAERGVHSPPQIELKINRKTILTKLADLPRKDVKASGLHTNEHCGFSIDLSKINGGKNALIYLKGTDLHL